MELLIKMFSVIPNAIEVLATSSKVLKKLVHWLKRVFKGVPDRQELPVKEISYANEIKQFRDEFVSSNDLFTNDHTHSLLHLVEKIRYSGIQDVDLSAELYQMADHIRSISRERLLIIDGADLAVIFSQREKELKVIQSCLASCNSLDRIVARLNVLHSTHELLFRQCRHEIEMTATAFDSHFRTIEDILKKLSQESPGMFYKRYFTRIHVLVQGKFAA